MPQRDGLITPGSPLRLRGAVTALALIGVAFVSSCGDSTGPKEPGEPAAVEITGGQGQRGVVGQQLPEALSVRVLDADGRAVPNATIIFRVVQGGGSVAAETVVSNSEGIAQNRWTLGTTAGAEQRVEVRGVSAETGEPVVFEVFHATAVPASAQKLVIVTAPSTPAQNRIPFPTQPAVQVQDAHGNAVGAGIVVTVAITSGGGTLSGTATATTGTNGTATFTDLSIAGLVGDRTLTFSSPPLTSVSAPVILVAGPPHRMEYAAGSSQSALIGEPVPIPPAAKLIDADGNPVPGVPVEFSLLDGSGSLTGASQVTDAAGIATVGSWTIGMEARVYTISATALGRFGVTFAATGIAFTVHQISAGGAHSCAVTPDWVAYCWGKNDKGQLGDGTTTNRLKPTAVSTSLRFYEIVAGPEHTCAIATDGLTYCWGRNTERQTGVETDAPVILTPAPVALGVRFLSLGLSYHGSCGLTAASSIYCWGGDPEVYSSSSPYPREVPGGHQFNVLASGWYHTCGRDITPALKTWCWGRNSHGQLGVSGISVSATPVQVQTVQMFETLAAGRHTCGLRSDLELYCWGEAQGPGFSDTSVPTEVLGFRFQRLSLTVGRGTCANGTDGKTYCWGESIGQLIDGSDRSYSTPTPISRQVRLNQFSAGFSHVCGNLTKREAVCWGENSDGQLGSGNTIDRAQPSAVTPP